MLSIEKLSVWVEEKNILDDISLCFEKWKNYALLWENGSGKSSLCLTLAGNPKYQVKSGKIMLEGRDITKFSPDERSKAWIFLSFQNVPEIPWVSLSEYLRTIYNNFLSYKKKQKGEEFRPLSPFLFSRFIKSYLISVGLSEEFLKRDLNVWFSGGEKRKLEILQMKMLAPSYIILDEVDSGLDRDALKMLGKLLKELDNKQTSFIIISHYFRLFDFLQVDEAIVLKKGKIYKKWGKEIIEKITESWFQNL